MSRVGLLLLLLAALGCSVPDVPFRCKGNAQCVRDDVQGLCQPTGYCSFPDAACTSGYRYADLVPPEMADRCVPIGCAEQIAVGEAHVCIRAGERVFCWGDPANGKLGHESPNPSVPMLLPNPNGLVWDLVAGEAHSCAIVGPNGDVWCWGDNASGQLGVTETSAEPSMALSSEGSKITGLTAGGSHSCAWGDDRAGCWGSNEHGQLGDPSITQANRHPQAVEPILPNGERFAQIAAGGQHTCGRSETGKIFCWGNNERGQVGPVPNTLLFQPTLLALERFPIIVASELVVGLLHTCARTTGEAILCWGDNENAQLGRLPEELARGGPVPLTPGTKVKQITAGSHHTCALLNDGSAVCWGKNDKGQLGPNATTGPSVPTQVPVALEGIEEIRAGGQTTCARTRDGAGLSTVWCWGDNSSGQLGIGAPDSDERPEPDASLNRYLSCPFR